MSILFKTSEAGKRDQETEHPPSHGQRMTVRHLAFALTALLAAYFAPAFGSTPTPPPTPTPVPTAWPTAPPEIAQAAAKFFKAVSESNGQAAWSMVTQHTQDELVATAAANYRTSEENIRTGITSKPGFLNSLFDDIRGMVTTGPWKATTNAAVWRGVWNAQTIALLSSPVWASQESGPLQLRFEGGAWRVAWTESLYPPVPEPAPTP